jgi:ribose 5-phosphate isomerase B
MKIALASDHAGFPLKNKVAEWIKQDDFLQLLDFGAYSDERVDYPDYAYPAAESVASGVSDYGILICGSGQGMCMTANKIVGIRAAHCHTVELAKLSREHNNANILCMGGRFLEFDIAKEIIKSFLYTDFEGGRHMIRVEKIHSLTGY